MGKVVTKTPFLILILLALTLAWSASAVFADGGKGQARAVAARGLVSIGGEDVIVEILVAVQPGENARAAAQAALKRAYPDAREIDSADFSTTGLVWDVFSDGDPGNDQVVVSYNDKGVPNNLANHRNVWLASMATWTGVATSNFVFSDGGDTGRCPSLVKECKGRQKFDGNNDVGWIDIADPSVLGVTWYGTKTDEFDMALDTKNFSWYIGASGSVPAGSFDTQTVWTHEFGHGLGLGHSDVEGAVMEPFYEGERRALHQDDIDGITFLYPAGSTNEAPVVTITSPDDGLSFGSGASIAFAGTASDAEDAGLSAAGLVWTSSKDGYIATGDSFSATLSDGGHTITASATDSDSSTGSASIDIWVGDPPAEPTTVSVASIDYATEGGKNGDKHLLVTVALVDDLNNAVSGASVSITLNNGGQSWVGTATTGSGGTVTFQLKNARSGHYSTTVTGVTATGLTWDGVTPANGFDK